MTTTIPASLEQMAAAIEKIWQSRDVRDFNLARITGLSALNDYDVFKTLPDGRLDVQDGYGNHPLIIILWAVTGRAPGVMDGIDPAYRAKMLQFANDQIETMQARLDAAILACQMMGRDLPEEYHQMATTLRKLWNEFDGITI